MENEIHIESNISEKDEIIKTHKNKIKFGINNVLKIVSMIGSVLIISGIFEAIVYYRCFGINITDYLSFSESLTLFFKTIIIIPIIFFAILFLFVLSGLGLITLTKKIGNIKFLNKTKELVNRKVLKNKLWHFKKKWIGEILFIVLIVIAIVIFDCSDIKKNSITDNIIFFAFIIVFIIGANRFDSVISDIKEESISIFGYIAAVVFCYVISIMYLGTSRAKGVLKDRGNFIEIRLKDIKGITEDTVKLDSTKVYIGKTNSFYFYYDKIKSTAHIIPAERVIEFSRKNINVDTVLNMQKILFN